MRSFRHCFVLATLALLAACSEPAPTSSGDGIFTAAQAERGEGLFNTHCVRCHSIQEFRGPAWNSIWAGAPLSALYVRIANTMPLDQPGSLGSTEATAITAHILAANGMPGGEEMLSGDLQWMTGISLSPTASN